MNEHPTPYEPKRRSRVKVVKGASEVPVTLTPLSKGLVTGTLGNVQLTSYVYRQLPVTDGGLGTHLATVIFNDHREVLGLVDGRVCRSRETDISLPHLILT